MIMSLKRIFSINSGKGGEELNASLVGNKQVN